MPKHPCKYPANWLIPLFFCCGQVITAGVAPATAVITPAWQARLQEAHSIN